MFPCSSEGIMEASYVSDEEEECDYCNPYYIFCESTGDDLCKPYKDRIFYNQAGQFILPNITRVLRSCNKALNRLSHLAHTEPPGCCCRRRIRDHACSCFCNYSKKEVSQCQKQYEDHSRIVEVVDASVSSPSLGNFSQNVGNQAEPLVEQKDKEEESADESESSEHVENEEEQQVACACDKSNSSFQEAESSCEVSCPQQIMSTSESDKEVCSPCQRHVTQEEHLYNERDKGNIKNININVKVRIHKKKKKSSESTSASERRKCKCKRKAQGEINKDNKKKWKCHQSKPILICDRKPDPGKKFLQFFKCKNLDGNIRENVERLCPCGKERISQKKGLEGDSIPSTERSLSIPTTKPIDSKNLSTIVEESNKLEMHTDRHSKNGSAIKSSNNKMKTRNISHEKMNKPGTTGGEIGSNIIRSESTEVEIRTNSYLESSKDGPKTKSQNHKKSRVSNESGAQVAGVSNHERKLSLGKESHDEGSNYRKSSRFRQQREEGSLIDDRMSESGKEANRKHKRKNEQLKDSKHGRKSHEDSGDKVSSENRNDVARTSGHLLPIFVNKSSEQHVPATFPFFEKQIYYLYQGHTHGFSYFKWYYKKQCSYMGVKSKLMHILPTTQLPRIILDRISNDTTQRPEFIENNGGTNNSCSLKTNFDYQQIYDLREIFEKFEVYKQQQFILEYTRLKRSSDYKFAKVVKLQKTKKRFRLEKENVKLLKVLAVHCLLATYFVIFVWFTFFD